MADSQNETNVPSQDETDKEVAEENEEQDRGITMVDVLAEENEMLQDADAVLGGADDTACTYDKGYVSRQPLYACLTCNPKSSGRVGGFCLACCYNCHEGHELIELYTKRNFRCDCGNDNFADQICKLNKNKDPKNLSNKYNQNFIGDYCTCARPYPDPEDTIEDEMIQCCVCEDWYHGRHTDTQVPQGNDFDEMICTSCVMKNQFLWYYLHLTTNAESVAKTNEEVDVEEITPDCPLKKVCKSSPQHSLFFKSNWRAQLCKCSECLSLYKTSDVSFLLELADPVAHYEAEGAAKRSEQAQSREMEALNSLDRITRTEMVHEYNTLSTSLRDYLRKFAENGKQVREEDIKEFFTQLAANKKQRPSLQLFCK